jgi:hypothetical protein
MSRELLILNRALPIEYGADEMPKRIHIVPRGELVNDEAGVTQIFDDKSLNSILADLRNRHAQKGGLYMGEEHFIYDSNKSSQAFAWGKEFGLDDMGIWTTKYEPTDVGAPAIKNKRFKWTSLVADPAMPGAIEKLGGGKIRILKIDTVGFTNYPNGKNLLVPITNRDPNFAGAGASTDSKQQNHQIKKMKTVCSLLGLSADADETSVHAAVAKLQNRVTELEGEVTPLKNRKTELEAENQTLLGEQVDGILAECKITDTKIINRLKPSLTPLKNRADRMSFLADLGYKPGAEKKETRVLNRGNGAAVANSTEDDDEKTVADKIKNRANELKGAAPQRKFDDCWKQAAGELAKKS